MSAPENSALPLAIGHRPVASRSVADGITLRLLLALLTLAVVCLLVPALYNGSTLLFSGVLVVLVSSRNRSANPREVALLPENTRRQLLTFLVLQSAIGAAAWRFAGELAALPHGGTLLAAASLSFKLLPLFPALALFPKERWLELGQKYHAELIAAAMVLFTFFPERQFQLIWPYYSQVLGKLVWLLSLPFLPDAIYLAEASPLVMGPNLIVHIVFECSGIEGLMLFDVLFGTFALLSWNRLNKRRLLMAYGIGVGAILLGNVLRILLIVVLGNLYWPTIGESNFHIHAGWVFFALVFVAFLGCTYGWMHRGQRAFVVTQSPLR